MYHTPKRFLETFSIERLFVVVVDIKQCLVVYVATEELVTILHVSALKLHPLILDINIQDAHVDRRQFLLIFW